MKEKILEIIKRKGPSFPTDISSELNTESYFVSAYLSEMISKKEILISNMKIGSSPLYFLPSQKNMLEHFSSKLNPKDKLAYEELKTKKVLRDSKLTPLLRVSLKNIKDFAIPLEVSFNNKKELFWKFYSIQAQEATELIKQYLSEIATPSSETLSTPSTPKNTTKVNNENQINPPLTTSPLKEVTSNDQANEKINIDSKSQELKKHTAENEDELIKLKKEIKKLKKENTFIKNKKQINNIEENTDLDSFDVEQRIKNSNDEFMKKIIDFLNDKNIEITDFEIIKKNSDIDIFIQIPTTLGRIQYLCKAKNKKRINETDLELSYASSIENKLPVIFLTNGDLTKKSKEKLATLKNIKFVNF